MARRYADEGGEPLRAERDELKGVPVLRRPLLDPEAGMARHHPDLLNQALRELIPRL